jgi:hypothetical protein
VDLVQRRKRRLEIQAMDEILPQPVTRQPVAGGLAFCARPLLFSGMLMFSGEAFLGKAGRMLIVVDNTQSKEEESSPCGTRSLIF